MLPVTPLDAGNRRPLGREALGVPAGAEGLDRVGLEAELLPQPRQQGPDVGLERVDEHAVRAEHVARALRLLQPLAVDEQGLRVRGLDVDDRLDQDRKSTRLNSSHSQISYAVFCLKKKTKTQ